MGDASAAECAYSLDGPRACAGGTPFLIGDLETGVVGPGHAGVLAYDKGGETVRVFTFHYYDHFDGGAAKLGANVLTFADGWPVLGEYWDVCDFTGCDPSRVSTTCSEGAEGEGDHEGEEDHEDYDGPRAEAGDEIDPSVGLVVIVGDSLLDGTGSTRGAFEGTLAARLGTAVYNNAEGGADFSEIMSMRACSSYDACTEWAIANGGINGMDDVSMEDFASRERAAGRSTVIIGYPPTLGGASGPTYDAMMASFATLAAESDDVYFVDPRTHPIMGDPEDPRSRPWRAEDNEHPSPRAGEWMANVAADYILGAGAGAGGGHDQDEEEEDVQDPEEEDGNEEDDADECDDSTSWVSTKGKTCDDVFQKNEKKSWKKKKAKKNCKKSVSDDDPPVKADAACACDACDKSRFKKKAKSQTSSVDIVVPVSVAAVLLVGAAAVMMMKGKSAIAQRRLSHRPQSMPNVVSGGSILKG